MNRGRARHCIGDAEIDENEEPNAPHAFWNEFNAVSSVRLDIEPYIIS